MAKRKLDEAYMKNLLAQGLPYKPATTSKVSSSEREKALQDIEGAENKTTSNQKEVKESEPEQQIKPKVSKTKTKKSVSQTSQKPLQTTESLEATLTMEDFSRLYFEPYDSHSKMSFLADRQLLQLLRRILWDTENSKVSLSTYVNNILADHINKHRHLINEATAQMIRKPTLPEL